MDKTWPAGKKLFYVVTCIVVTTAVMIAWGSLALPVIIPWLDANIGTPGWAAVGVVVAVGWLLNMVLSHRN